MKIKEHKIKNKNVIQVYLTNREKDNTNIKNKIEEIKSKNRNVVLFVSGENEPIKVLKEMVKIMKNSAIVNL